MQILNLINLEWIEIFKVLFSFPGQRSRVSRLRPPSRTPNFASEFLHRSSVGGRTASDSRTSADAENADAIVTQKRHLRVALGRTDASNVVKRDADESNAAGFVVGRRFRRRRCVVEPIGLGIRVDDEPGSILSLAVRKGERGHDDRLESDARTSRSAPTGVRSANRGSRFLDASPSLRHRKWSATGFQSVLFVIKQNKKNGRKLIFI